MTDTSFIPRDGSVYRAAADQSPTTIPSTRTVANQEPEDVSAGAPSNPGGSGTSDTPNAPQSNPGIVHRSVGGQTTEALEQRRSVGETAGHEIREAGRAQADQDAQQAQVDAETEARLGSDPRTAAAYTEFKETGDLSAETTKRLAAGLNLPEGVVRAYVDGQRAQAQQAQPAAAIDASVQLAHDAVGGAHNWPAFAAWANTSLPEADLRGLIAAVNDAPKNSASASLVIKNTYARFLAAGGTTPANRPAPNHGGSAAPEVPAVFASRDQMVRAMSSPLYNRDPAYTKAVEEAVRNMK